MFWILRPDIGWWSVWSWKEVKIQNIRIAVQAKHYAVIVPSDCTIFDNQKNCCLFKVQTTSTVVEERFENVFKRVENTTTKNSKVRAWNPHPSLNRKRRKTVSIGTLAESIPACLSTIGFPIYQKRLQVFYQGSKHRATDESTRVTCATV